MCLAAMRCRVDSYARHAHCSIYAVQWTHICSATPCQLPNAHCLHFLCATALLGILTPHTFSTNGTEGEKKNCAEPHTFSTNSTEEENKKSAGPLVWRGGGGENGCSAIH